MRTPIIALLVALLLSASATALHADSQPTVYDNFDDPQWDGTFNNDLWSWDNGGNPDLFPKQENGQLTFVGNTVSSPSFAHLIMRQPASRTLSQVQHFEAHFQLDNNHRGDGWAMIVLQLEAANINGRGWWTYCALVAQPNPPDTLLCTLNTNSQSQGAQEEWTTSRSVSLAQGHTLALEVDPNTARIRYLMDGELVDAHTPNDAAALLMANNLSPNIVFGNATPGSNVTRHVDNVRITHVVQFTQSMYLPQVAR